MSYIAPVQDIEFALTAVAELDKVNAYPAFEEATEELVSAVLEEAARFAGEVLSPLNSVGDVQGSQLVDGQVVTPDGWKEAYQQFCDNGWGSLAFDPNYGGQGLPMCVSAAVQEMWHSANMAFGLCPLLTQGAVDAIHSHGSESMKDTYLPKMVEGKWTGTMNLTEPQAGSDLAAIRTSAVKEGEHYRIRGQKIFITYGEHEMSENIIHLVLARTPDAPAGVKGISLFVVPRYLVDENGSIGDANDVKCVSLEHKLGIHASPTAVMAFGENDGALGYLIGEENQGLMYMFTMMNIARHAVGVEGYSIASRAYQQAVEYSQERVQGRALLQPDSTPAGIIHHPDIRRLLLTMRSGVEAMRMLALTCAASFDIASQHPDSQIAQKFQQRGELLTPLVKGWSTEEGVNYCSMAVQVHGGMGYIEETGVAQYLRDSRITPIYEGTTAIQANDLVGRKTLRDTGQSIVELTDDMKMTLLALRESSNGVLSGCLATEFSQSIEDLELVVKWFGSDQAPANAFAVSVDYLLMFGRIAGGWCMMRAALAADEKLNAKNGDAEYFEAKILLAKFYAERTLPEARALKAAIMNSSDVIVSFPIEQY